MAQYSTGEVAKLIGVSKNTLLRWLYAEKLPEPTHATVAGQDVRVWGERDLARARKFKEANYWKGRGGNRRATDEIARKAR